MILSEMCEVTKKEREREKESRKLKESICVFLAFTVEQHKQSNAPQRQKAGTRCDVFVHTVCTPK